MLSYKDQCRRRRKRGSGERRMALSVAERALVGMTPQTSPIVASRDTLVASVTGFSRRTSSRSTDRMLSPRLPFQPAEPPCAESGLSPTPLPVRPYSSRLLTPTIAFHKRSLSSRPSSEARLYTKEETGSEYDVPFS
jgi:hypothetical protein